MKENLKPRATITSLLPKKLYAFLGKYKGIAVNTEPTVSRKTPIRVVCRFKKNNRNRLACKIFHNHICKSHFNREVSYCQKNLEGNKSGTSISFF